MELLKLMNIIIWEVSFAQSRNEISFHCIMTSDPGDILLLLIAFFSMNGGKLRDFCLNRMIFFYRVKDKFIKSILLKQMQLRQLEQRQLLLLQNLR